MKTALTIALAVLFLAAPALAATSKLSQFTNGGSLNASTDQLVAVRTGTSTTSITIGTGSQTFTTQSGLGYVSGQLMTVAETSNSSNVMSGSVASYSGTTLVLNVTTISGSGSHSDWTIAGDMLVTPGAGSGTVTTLSVASANGLSGTVANPTTTPAITLGTTVTGVLKGNGAAISAASAGTDYLAPFGSQTANAFYAAPNGSSGTPSFRSIAAADVPTLNQNTTGSAATVGTINGLITPGSNVTITGSGTSGSPYAIASSGGGSGTPGGSSGQVQYNNSGSFGGLTNPAALTQISSGIMVDPRNYGATCSGQTYASGPTHNDSSNDTLGFELAEIAAITYGGAVMVPYGCWVSNLQLMDGAILVGQDWATNYGFDYGYGEIGSTLVLTPGSGYTNGTYPLNTLNNAGSGTGFTTGNNAGYYLYPMTSTTSMTIGTGSQTFTETNAGGAPNFGVNSWITVSENGTSANYMFGQVTAISGTTITFNVTQTGGSGTNNNWNVYSPSIVTVSAGKLSSYLVTNQGSGYPSTTTIPIPAGAGSGTGGLISMRPVTVQNEPYSQPVLYTIGSPSYTINLNGAETVALVGFEIYGGGASAIVGETQASQGYGGKIWLYQMTLFSGNYGFYGQSCYDYLVTQNSTFAGLATGLGGCFSDWYSQGDTFVSNGTAINGSGAGFERLVNDRIEYNNYGVAGSAFLQVGIVGTQFDHQNGCDITVQSGQTINMTGGVLKAGGTGGSFQVTGTAKCAANNDVCLAVNSDNASGGGQSSVTGFITTGQNITVLGVGGTTEANGNWTLTKVDGTHIDLQGTTYAHAYTSGGYAGVAGLDADICLEGSNTGGGSVASLNFTNVQYDNATSVNGCCAPFSIIDMTTSGANNDWISFEGGEATPFGSSGIESNAYDSYSGKFANFRVSNPAHYRQELLGQPRIVTDDSNLSINYAGQIGIGTTSPESGTVMDFTSSTQGAIGLPQWATGSEPTAHAGSLGYDTTLNSPRYYNGTAWTTLGSGGGGSVSVTAGTSNIVVNPSPGTGTFTVGVTNPINAQGTAASYTIASTDMGKTITHNKSTSVADSLPAATTSGFGSGQGFSIINYGAGTVTVTPTTSTINGLSSLSLAQYAAAYIISDGSNYYAFLGGPGGGGTAYLAANQSWTAGQAVTPTTGGTQSAGGTYTPNFASSNSATLTFGAGNLTIANPTNISAGQNYQIALTQDSGGSRTVTWGSDFKWAGGTAPTLSTGNGAKDIISCWADTTTTLNCTLAIANAD